MLKINSHPDLMTKMLPGNFFQISAVRTGASAYNEAIPQLQTAAVLV